MTKKKMRKLIISGVLIFFVASSLLVFMMARSDQDRTFREHAQINSDSLLSFDNSFESANGELYEKSPEQFKLLYLHGLSRQRQNAMYAYSMAIADREGNLTFASDNFVYIRYRGTYKDIYVDFEPYLTDELRKEMGKYLRKESNKYMQNIEELSVYFDGEKYIPIKMKIRIHGDDISREYVFTDCEPTEVILKKDTIYFLACFNELCYPIYDRIYIDYLKEDIKNFYEWNKDNLSFEYGGGSSLSTGRYSLMQGTEIGDGYEVFISCAYNTYVTTLLSENFQFMLVYLAFLFAVAGIIFYIMCMKVVTKSEKLDEAKSTFISGASHELKTPLAVIQNQCECIMENIAPEKNDEYIKSIYDEALRMNGIVSSLLSYSRLTQMTAVKKERCNLSELLREEVRNYRKFAENNDVTITENIADDIYADCDAQLMKMAFGNYISNAIKYAAGNKVVDVRLSKNTVIVMEVVNPAHKENADIALGAWDEFSRGDVSRQRQGASIGMGLPICKKIFELHGFSGYSQYKDGLMTFRVHIS